MDERVHATGTPDVESKVPAREDASPVSRVLALQRSVGNAAVVALLRRAMTPAPATSATTQSSRDWFSEEMARRWGITDIKATTQAEQLTEVGRYSGGQSAPTSLPGWQAWEPAVNSDMFSDILDGFDALAAALGGIPPVTDIRFANTAYESSGGVATANPDEAASYASGHVRINRKLETARWPLPLGRSTAQAEAGLTIDGVPQSRRRIITHELCHGVYEQAGATDPAVFTAWPSAAGWSGGRIVQNGTPLDRSNWNRDWAEQPVSAYSLNNPMEDFCESLACYIERPEVLRQRSPARYEFIRSHAGSWRGFLQPRRMSEPGDFYGPDEDWRYA